MGEALVIVSLVVASLVVLTIAQQVRASRGRRRAGPASIAPLIALIVGGLAIVAAALAWLRYIPDYLAIFIASYVALALTVFWRVAIADRRRRSILRAVVTASALIGGAVLAWPLFAIAVWTLTGPHGP